jgi:hypothetical protein
MASNTTFVSGAILTAQQQNNFPFGVQGYVKRTAASVSIGTTIADVTGATVTFTAIAGRAYKFSFNATVTKNVTVGTLALYVADGSNNNQYEFLLEMNDTASGYIVSLCTVVTGLTAGTQTLKLRGVVSVATSTIFATATNPYSLIVEDIGIA